MVVKLYSRPEGAGWLGWIENEKGMTIAFITLDGSVVWSW